MNSSIFISNKHTYTWPVELPYQKQKLWTMFLKPKNLGPVQQLWTCMSQWFMVILTFYPLQSMLIFGPPQTLASFLMIRKFKQWWSRIPPISAQLVLQRIFFKNIFPFAVHDKFLNPGAQVSSFFIILGNIFDPLHHWDVSSYMLEPSFYKETSCQIQLHFNFWDFFADYAKF